MQNVQPSQQMNVETFKKTRLDTLTVTNGDKGYEVLFSFIDAPRQPKARGQVPTFDVSVSLNKQEQLEFLQILEPYSVYIEQVFAHTSRRKASYFKPEKDKISKQPTGVEMLTIKNSFPVKVFDINNNEILPAPRIPKGSKVGLQFGVVPFELNGENGVSMTRLYAVKVFSWGESSSGGFGASTGEAMSIPDYAKPRVDQHQAQPQGNPMMNYGQPQPNQAMQHNPMMNYGQAQPQGNPMMNYGQPQPQPQANPMMNYGQPQVNPMAHNPATGGVGNPNGGTMHLGTPPNIGSNPAMTPNVNAVGGQHPFAMAQANSQEGL